MIELNISRDEFIKLMSGANNKTCPESNYCYLHDINKKSMNGIGFMDGDDFMNIYSIKDKISSEFINDSIQNIFNKYKVVIILKIVPIYGKYGVEYMVEYIPLNTYFEYMGERYPNNDSQELEATEKSMSLVRKIFSKK